MTMESGKGDLNASREQAASSTSAAMPVLANMPRRKNLMQWLPKNMDFPPWADKV